MQRLKGHSTIVSYEDHRAYPHADGPRVGYPHPHGAAPAHQRRPAPAEDLHPAEVLRLGIDLCSALEVCQKNNIIHRDIKPGNIFLSQEGSFKLGDFGVARIASASMAASTRAGTVNYMAPEVFQGRRYTSSVDIYSLGLVLYQLLNMNRMPFYPPPPQNITPDQQERARARRFSGEPLPPPAQADPALAAVVLKACAWDPAARYASPAKMRQALEALTAAPAPAGRDRTPPRHRSHSPFRPRKRPTASTPRPKPLPRCRPGLPRHPRRKDPRLPGKGPRRDGPSAALAGKAAHPGRRIPCRRAKGGTPADCAQKAAARPEAGPRRRQGAGRPAPTARSRRMAAVSPRPAINSGNRPRESEEHHGQRIL